MVYKAGLIVIPKPMGEELQLDAGDSLDLKSSEDQISCGPNATVAASSKNMECGGLILANLLPSDRVQDNSASAGGTPSAESDSPKAL